MAGRRLRWEEAEDVPEYAVRQDVDAAFAAERWRHRSLATFPWTHCVEQVSGVEDTATR
jgi:hypothetical protein